MIGYSDLKICKVQLDLIGIVQYLYLVEGKKRQNH